MGTTLTPSDGPRHSAESVKYRRVYARGRFNQKVNRLIAILTKLRVELSELSELEETVTRDWADAGLSATPANPWDLALLEQAEEMAADADRFDWAVHAYLGELESFAV